ncbi:hypothetical protein [Streptomyces sp. Y1]|uniref:Uncharacterized protein n=1 Tax=Streptomyces sp. Y1 TaxID=3238634 RepID=A0AB39TVL9_9ACTN
MPRVQIASCVYASIDGNTGWDTLLASTWVYNPSGVNIDVCFQALWVNPGRLHEPGLRLHLHRLEPRRRGVQGPQLGWVHPSAGTFVVQAGFWATINGHYGYYGAVQSPRITTDGQNDF